MPDITQDYLLMDYLIAVQYFSATGNGVWSDGQTVNNCSFFDNTLSAILSDTDIRQQNASLIIRHAEWPASGFAATPQRGDKFTIVLTDATVTFLVQGVDDDPDRRQDWRLWCYAL